MRNCGETRHQICKLVKEVDKFYDKHRVCDIKYYFDCDSKGVVYLIKCKKKYLEVYVVSTIDSLRSRFNNHKSSMKRYERG